MVCKKTTAAVEKAKTGNSNRRRLAVNLYTHSDGLNPTDEMPTGGRRENERMNEKTTNGTVRPMERQ